MIDIGLVRRDLAGVSQNLARRGVAASVVEQLSELDATWRALTQAVDELRAKQNQASESIANASAGDKAALIETMQAVAAELKANEKELMSVTTAREAAWRRLPNLVAGDVPEGGADEAEVMRVVPEQLIQRDFSVQDYFSLGEGTLFNLAEAARVSGSGFAYILGDLARLQMGLVSWVFDVLAADDFLPVIPPVLVSETAMAGMGYLGEHSNEVYETQDGLYLVGTSEQSLGSGSANLAPMHIRKRYPNLEKPRRFVGYSSCFRREAGSHGKAVRGLLRLHQFEKIEMFSFTRPEDSADEHEFLLSKQEQLMQALNLPYRVVKLAAGDLGAPAAKTYDIETWLPSEQRYVETHSTSNTTDYQARRLNIRVGKGSDVRFVHMLNGTALAMSRIFIALLENHQQADGSIAMPPALHSYLPFQKIE